MNILTQIRKRRRVNGKRKKKVREIRAMQREDGMSVGDRVTVLKGRESVVKHYV